MIGFYLVVTASAAARPARRPPGRRDLGCRPRLRLLQPALLGTAAGGRLGGHHVRRAGVRRLDRRRGRGPGHHVVGLLGVRVLPGPQAPVLTAHGSRTLARRPRPPARPQVGRQVTAVASESGARGEAAPRVPPGARAPAAPAVPGRRSTKARRPARARRPGQPSDQPPDAARNARPATHHSTSPKPIRARFLLGTCPGAPRRAPGRARGPTMQPVPAIRYSGSAGTARVVGLRDAERVRRAAGAGAAGGRWCRRTVLRRAGHRALAGGLGHRRLLGLQVLAGADPLVEQGARGARRQGLAGSGQGRGHPQRRGRSDASGMATGRLPPAAE